jgi:putative (di)nucleoside polyphosphate hydrolase
MTAAKVARLPYRPCVGIVLANPQGLVFAGQRSDRDQDAWQMPQGGIDPGEKPDTAALRELCEETGVTADLVTIEAETGGWITYDLPPDIVPSIWHGRYRGQKQKWFLMRYHGRDDQIDLTAHHAEFSRWMWIEPATLIAGIVPFKQDAYARVFAEFGELL